MYSFRMSFCSVPGDLVEISLLLFGDDEIHRQKDRSRCVDRLRNSYLIERDAVEQNFEIGKRRNGDTALSDLAFGQRRICIESHQGGQIVGDATAPSGHAPSNT